MIWKEKRQKTKDWIRGYTSNEQEIERKPLGMTEKNKKAMRDHK